METLTLFEKVLLHHKEVEKRLALSKAIPVITMLIGSQNYGLATPESDVDTFTFVFPNFEDFICGKTVKSFEFQVDEDGGKCMVKDIREAFNLLRKCSPNSVECALSEYRYINPRYADPFYENITSDKFYLTHCDYFHMLQSCLGMAKQVKNRNMPLGKKVAHALRMEDLSHKYLNQGFLASGYLYISEPLLSMAQKAKEEEFSTDRLVELYENSIKAIENRCDYFNELMKEQKSMLQFKAIENLSKSRVMKLQTDLTNIYLRENGYTKAFN